MSRYVKTYIRTCARNKNLNQSTHPRGLFRVFVVHMKFFIIGYGYSPSEDFDQTARDMSEGTFLTLRSCHTDQGSIVRRIVSLTNSLVVKMLTILVNTISNSQVFLLNKK